MLSFFESLVFSLRFVGLTYVIWSTGIYRTRIYTSLPKDTVPILFDWVIWQNLPLLNLLIWENWKIWVLPKAPIISRLKVTFINLSVNYSVLKILCISIKGESCSLLWLVNNPSRGFQIEWSLIMWCKAPYWPRWHYGCEMRGFPVPSCCLCVLIGYLNLQPRSVIGSCDDAESYAPYPRYDSASEEPQQKLQRKWCVIMTFDTDSRKKIQTQICDFYKHNDRSIFNIYHVKH